MSFNLEEFISSPTVEEINTLRKTDLLTIAQHYKLGATSATTKAQVKQMILQYFVDEEIFPDSTIVSAEQGMMTEEELLELKHLEFQEKEKEREAQLRLKELELSTQLKLKELEVRGARSSSGETGEASFDVSKHIKFVLTFSEAEVDKYFLHFEKVAKSLKWPKESWTLLLQSSLVRKAREIYSALSIEESCQYDVVKAAVLKVYELVLEAYQQKFRERAKRVNQTFVEFARSKETLFDRWCTSKDISGNYEKL